MAQRRRSTRTRGGDAEEPRARPAGPRPVWSGTITFGLVSVPVELFPGVRSTGPTLRMLAPDGTPLSRRYTCPAHGRDLEAHELIKGYELEDGSYVPVTDEELDSLAPRRSRDIELTRFVPRTELDEFGFDRAFVLTPSTESTKPYRLLARVLEDDRKAGIGSFVMRNKEHIVAILAEHGILMAQTIRFADEVRSPADVGLKGGDDVPRDAVQAFAKAIEAGAAKSLERDELLDERSARLRDLVEKKLRKGEDVVDAPAAAAEDDVDGEGGEIVPPDLFEAIRRRLHGIGADEEPAPAPAPERRPRRRSAPRAEELSSLSKDELYARAKDLDVPGRSSMTKDQLVAALKGR